jgi:hypothetical protein
MSDDTDYLDENGNDLRYGKYYFGAWRADPPKIVELKKSGKWYTMLDIQRRWAWQNYMEFDPVQLDRLRENYAKVHQAFAEMRQERLAKSKMTSGVSPGSSSSRSTSK